MRGLIGGTFIALCTGWIIYSMAGATECEKMYRGASPVRMGFDIVRWGTQNWLSQDSRISLLLTSVNADYATRRFLTQQFYGSSVSCGDSKK